MDAVAYIDEMLSSRALEFFVNENVILDTKNLFRVSTRVKELRKFMKCRKFMVIPGDEKKDLIENVQLAACKVRNLMNGILGHGSKKQSSNSGNQDLVKDWKETLKLIFGIVVTSEKLNQTELEGEVTLEVYEALNPCYKIKIVENMLLEETTVNSIFIPLNEEERLALFLMKVFPVLGELKESPKIHNFLFELSNELVNLPHLIFNTLRGESPEALLLIGGLLSLKPIAYDTWNRVKDDLVNIKEQSHNCVASNNMRHIITYCYDDLPYFLKLCFLYIACYPIGFEICTTSLTQKWMAEGFVTPEEGKTVEDTAHNYLEQLVQRSLVCPSKRSILGTIKSCRVTHSIYEFARQQSYIDGFLVVNPAHEEIESSFRVAIFENPDKVVNSNHIHSFLAFNSDINVLGSVELRVLELSKCPFPVIGLPNMIKLRYLNLRGSNICGLPKNMGEMENLETLDVRDTSIEVLPESLWNISTLRHVYVKPGYQNEGPSSAANLSNLQVLKTVVAHKSWLENIPLFLIHLRKFGLSIWGNVVYRESKKYYESTSNLLSHMDELISMTIRGDIIPSEFVDIRAFPNLETVKAIKVEGKWIGWKLPIDNIKFSPNLTKLTLIGSHLKEDPMPTLGRLQTLKFLSLQDEAYIGKQIVCSTNEFPQLQFLEFKKLVELDNLEVKPAAMPQLTKFHVSKCRKLFINSIHPNLDHVIDIVIY